MQQTKRWQSVGLLVGMVFTLIGCGKTPPTPSAVSATTRTPLSSETVATNTVSLTESNFVPTVIKIAAGTTVTWTNKDTVPHTISSDPYPTNTALAGFDSVQPIEPGQTYSFTFERAGTWTYHDQLRPGSYTGAVIVVKD